MKVFISWSGTRSHAVAKALRDWLPLVLQYVEPWVSSEDIDKGTEWSKEVGEELQTSSFGIICLVPENLREPWINFEAGAMAYSINAKRISPFLVGFESSEIPGPLAQFQFTVFEKEDVRKMIRSINRQSDIPLNTEWLNRAFDAVWPNLQNYLEAIHNASVPNVEIKVPTTDLEDQRAEILSVLSEYPLKGLHLKDISNRAGQNITRALYHLGELEQEGMVECFSVLGVTMYSLTNQGRAYVVERNLV